MKYKEIIITLVVIALILIYCIFTGNKKDTTLTSSIGNATNINVKEGDKIMNGKYIVLISVQGYGDIKVELDGTVAPISVTNFINLVNQGFYNGTTFHRIMKGFMIQGGNGEPLGRHANNIKGEFRNNGVENNISHVRGVISMARATDMNSGSSQFFIVHQDATYLDGNYAGFGHVIEGMDVVDRIAEAAQPTDNNGTIPQAQQPVISSVTVIG
jgi:peptidyl-prolyl cis-trans isomerase B (cyclophilin B)